MKVNKTEKLKAALSPYDFRHNLTQLDFSNLTESDRFYLKNYGIYNSKLRPEAFMLRLRIAAGRIPRAQLRSVLDLAQSFDLQIILTARAQMELHGLDAGNVLQIWQRLSDAGIVTLQTLTDNFRNIVTDVYDGVDSRSRVEVYPLVLQMQRLFLDRPEWIGMLPRKLNTAICGSEASHLHFFGNDLFFALAQKEGVWGFNIYLGGKNSQSAQDANLFVLPDQAVAMFEAVARAYATYGLRGSRAKTRLFHLIDAIGMEAFVEKIAQFYPHTLQTKGSYAIQKRLPADCIPIQDGRYAHCIRSDYGKADIRTLLRVLDLAEADGAEVRLGIDQNLYLIGSGSADPLFAKPAAACEITACAGSRYCALSLWDIKEETACLPLALLEKHHIQVGFSGCLKGCGRHQHADIGLVGLRTNLFGEVEKAARVFLGGVYSSEGARPARLLYYVVPLRHLRRMIEVIVGEYRKSGKEDFETFSREVLYRYSDAFMTLWFLAVCALKPDFSLGAPEEILYAKLCQSADFPHTDGDKEYAFSIRALMQTLWKSN